MPACVITSPFPATFDARTTTAKPHTTIVNVVVKHIFD